MKDFLPLVFNGVQLCVVVVGAVVAYFRLWREGVHNSRIQLGIDAEFLGPQNGDYVASVAVKAENKGNVEHQFEEIRLTVRGISSGENLSIMSEHANRLEFPRKLVDKENLVPPKFGYFFVRPGIEETFLYVTKVPEDIRFVLARVTFKYKGSEEIHSAERVFALPCIMSRGELRMDHV